MDFRLRMRCQEKAGGFASARHRVLPERSAYGSICFFQNTQFSKVTVVAGAITVAFRS